MIWACIYQAKKQFHSKELSDTSTMNYDKWESNKIVIIKKKKKKIKTSQHRDQQSPKELMVFGIQLVNIAPSSIYSRSHILSIQPSCIIQSTDATYHLGGASKHALNNLNPSNQRNGIIE